ncbi:MAG: DUF4388 domain-containing protein [Anaerolineae bacterium]
MAIEGRLSEMDLATLVQYACTENQQACLRIQRGEEEAVLYFDAGNVVHAELNEHTGEEVFYRILRWKEGTFILESAVAPPARTITRPWSALLMDGLQQLDEETWDHTSNEEDYEMPENIQEILEELGEQLSGFIAAAVVGMDGLGIADHAVRRVEVETINAQMTLLLKLVDTTINKLNPNDEMDDYLLTTENAYLLIRFLRDRNYYLGIAADRRSAKLGNLRLNSRLYSERIDKALPH